VQSAIDAANAIHTLIQDPSAAVLVADFLDRRLARRAARHAAYTGSFYRTAAESILSYDIPNGCPTTIFWIPQPTPTSSQRNTSGRAGWKRAGPGCYDAVAIARAAGFRMLVISRTASVIGRLSLNHSEPAKKSGQNIPKNRCRTTSTRS
jgi:hypothetical protein